jgi:hypothetical protein
MVTLWALLAAGTSCHRSRSEEAKDGGVPSDIGIAECDDYVAKYQRCIADKVPSDHKKIFEDALARTHTSWKMLASNPGARPGLPQACMLARQAAQTTLKQYACSW